MGIALSKKHGVNPSMITCPVCGKEMSIALLGRLKGDVEAPKTIKGDELCDDCKKKYITVVEVNPSGKGYKGTGRKVFVPKDSIKVDARDGIVLMLNADFEKTFINNHN